VTLRAPGLLLAAALLVRAAELAAQNPIPLPPRADTARAPGAAARDTGAAAAPRRDTIPLPDSLSPDSFRPQLPPLGAPPGPLPRTGRIVFDHDEFWFSGAVTLGELLERVPGVFLVRAGWFGRPEIIQYAGQGASSIEVYWDGFAMDPLGQDSTGLDLSGLNLGLVQRAEVEVLPSVVRVYLYSDEQVVRKPRTETSFATGDASTNSYRIRYLNRWKNGTGLDLGVIFQGSSGVVTSQGRSSDVTLWAKGSWIPTERYGVQYQVVSVSLDRDSVKLTSDRPLFLTELPSHRAHRTDMFLRGFIATRNDGMGLRLDAIAGGSTYTDTSAALERQEMQGSAIVGYRAERWSTELTTRVRDSSTPLELELRGSVSPSALLTVSGYAISRTHLGGRHSNSTDVGAQAELRPVAAIALHGALRLRNAVGAPALLTDTAQKVTDFSAGISLTTRQLDLDVSLARHGVFAPAVPGTFGPIMPAYPSLAVRTATVSVAWRPRAYVTFSGWYREPLVKGTAELQTSAYEPPHHSRVWATFRSRLLPVLRRGAFDFTAEVAMEGWSRGVWGADSSGAPRLLKGATILDYRVELRLLNAALFWSIRNARGERYSVLPGLNMPVGNQTYGVRWEFTN